MDATDVLDLLILARAFVEAGWQKGFMATDRQKRITATFADDAAHFCAMGALARAAVELDPNPVPIGIDNLPLAVADRVLTQTLRDRCQVRFVQHFNDAPDVEKSDVLALFDAACERVGKG